jgi:hypothetical protein
VVGFALLRRIPVYLQCAPPPVSVATNTVHLTVPKSGVFELIGLNWDSSTQVADITLGTGRKFNVAGGFMQPSPNGDLYTS